VYDGDYLAIVGGNGSGKSTLIKGLAGLLAPSTGEIEICNSLRRKDIGYLPQQSAAQADFPASVMEVVLSGCLNNGGFRPFYSSLDKHKANNWLLQLGISHLSKKSFRELSGGQQQRVLLARALCSASKLILMDEPIAGLDPHAQAEFYHLCATLPLTIVMVSHDLTSALSQATHILHLDTHQLFFGTVLEYQASGIGDGFMGCTHPHGHDASEHKNKPKYQSKGEVESISKNITKSITKCSQSKIMIEDISKSGISKNGEHNA
jgi:zinc transport system ATP-binding protein